MTTKKLGREYVVEHTKKYDGVVFKSRRVSSGDEKADADAAEKQFQEDIRAYKENKRIAALSFSELLDERCSKVSEKTTLWYEASSDYRRWHHVGQINITLSMLWMAKQYIESDGKTKLRYPSWIYRITTARVKRSRFITIASVEDIEQSGKWHFRLLWRPSEDRVNKAIAFVRLGMAVEKERQLDWRRDVQLEAA